MTEILINDFVIVLLITLRITGAFIAVPIYGHKALPVLVKLFLSFFIAYLIFLTLDTENIHIELTTWFLASSAIKELLAGLILGFMLNFVFYGILYAGSLIGFDMGLAISNMFDPAEGINSNAIGELLYFASLLIFLLINGHHYIVEGLSFSFITIPIGSSVLNQSVSDLIVKYSVQVFIIALKIASPIMVSFFLVHIAEGIIARVIPQMQVFFVTQPLKIGLGFIMLASIAPVYIYVIKNLLKNYENQLVEIIRAMR
jgi:flagellar biosynthesis protein FliR